MLAVTFYHCVWFHSSAMGSEIDWDDCKTSNENSTEWLRVYILCFLWNIFLIYLHIERVDWTDSSTCVVISQPLGHKWLCLWLMNVDLCPPVAVISLYQRKTQSIIISGGEREPLTRTGFQISTPETERGALERPWKFPFQGLSRECWYIV